MRRLELIGIRFGRLVVLDKAPRTYQTMWRCLCDCGKETVVTGQGLTKGSTTSCGCYREELRPMYASMRDYTGEKNPRAKKSKRLNSGIYVPSNNSWYKRAAGIYYAAKRKGVHVGFSSAAELATYVVSILPPKCPVFGTAFTERGKGFSRDAPSIDKIDPKKGYVRGNIQVISMFANKMKQDATPAELAAFAKWIIKDTK